MFDHLDDPLPFHPDHTWWADCAARSQKRRRARRRRVGALGILACSLLALLVAGGWTRVRLDAVDRLDVAFPGPGADAGGTDGLAPTGTVTVLAIGTDADLGGAGVRADAIVVVRIDVTARTVRTLAIPRDTVLWSSPPTDGTGSVERASAIFQAHGVQGLVDALATAGIRIDHVAVVSPDGLRRLVDAIGGVEVDFLRPVRDPSTGLLITSPGCRRLDGTTTLQLVRARHLEWEDTTSPGWIPDASGDLGRVTRTETVGRIIARALVATSPTALPALLDAAGEGVALDRGWSAADVVALGAWAREQGDALTHEARFLIGRSGWLDTGQGRSSVLWADGAAANEALDELGRDPGAGRLPGPADAGSATPPPLERLLPTPIVIEPCP